MQVEMEQQKAKEAEERLSKARTTEEARVAALEAKLSELSSTVGNYDRVKQQDQIAIQWVLFFFLNDKKVWTELPNICCAAGQLPEMISSTVEQKKA